jgi:hypothetical protein
MQNTKAPGGLRQNAAVQLRLGPLFELVENWRRSQPMIPPRSKAIRELVRLALEAAERQTPSRTSARVSTKGALNP